MDTLGDGSVLDDDAPATAVTWFTPEARVLTAAGLVLAAFTATDIFQYLAFFVLDNNGGRDSGMQYTVFAGPAGAMAAAGAWLGWQGRTDPLAPVLRGLGGAATVIGAFLAAAVAVGIIVAFFFAPDQF